MKLTQKWFGARRWGGIDARGYIMADAHASHHFRRIRKNTHNPMGKYLGFDCSTESLTAVVIDTDSGSILNQCQLIYEEAVPQYQDSKGLLKSNGALVRHSSPLMWAAGLEILLWRLKAQGVEKINDVTWFELGMPEAIWDLQAKEFGPLVVGMDTHGGSIYASLKQAAFEKIDALYPA